MLNIMNIYFDIGGTNLRCYNNLRELVNIRTGENVLIQIIKVLDDLSIDNKINKINICIAGIIEDNKIYGCGNINLRDGSNLIKSYNGIDINYLNDGDAFILGEVDYNMVSVKGKNILGVIFGTGVGSGLIMNGKLVKNSEINKLLEPFMKSNYLRESNIDKVCKFLGERLGELVELLNLDMLILNGYVNKFDNLVDKLRRDIKCNIFYLEKLEILMSDCKLSNILGLKNI